MSTPAIVLVDVCRAILALVAVAVLVVTPHLLRLSVDDGQRGRFWGSTALLVAVIIGQIQSFGTPMRWSFPIVIVGVVSIAYGSFDMLRRSREGERNGP